MHKGKSLRRNALMCAAARGRALALAPVAERSLRGTLPPLLRLDLLHAYIAMSSLIAFRRATRAVVLFAVVALAACGDSSTAPASEVPDGNGNNGGNNGGNPLPVAVASVEVAPLEQGAVIVGAQRQFRATLRAADGSVLSGRGITWSISHAERGQIDAAGTVTARQPGPVVVTATSEGRSGTAQLEIAARTVARFELSVRELDIVVGDRSSVQALPLDAMGQLMHDAPIAWSSADPAVASVDNSGVVTAVRGGETVLTVSSGSATATVTVRVPRTMRLVLKDLSGNALPATIDSETSYGEPGLTHRIRWVVKGGTLDLSTTGDSKWRQELRVTIYEDLISSVGGNTIVSTTEHDSFTLLDEGTRVANAAGILVFQSSTTGRAPYAVGVGSNGSISITERPLGYGAEHVLHFGKP